MSKFSNIRKELSSLETVERELNLKQLQINRLLTITQAINNNIKAKSLYDMYNSFLSWEMGVKKMALFVLDKGKWSCASFIGVDEQLVKMDITEHLSKYQRLKNLDNEKEHPLPFPHPPLRPDSHKRSPL